MSGHANGCYNLLLTLLRIHPQTFDPANLGTAEEVVEERIADDSMIMIRCVSLASACHVIAMAADTNTSCH